ncbi:hypothetical protein MPSEU_000014600 [Mayamaea pseudoterrestris]|nr:hypothetical protein MPSEU_000014600 [Mayamaea pseudoterrestris]
MLIPIQSSISNQPAIKTSMYFLLITAVSAATFVPSLPSFRGLPTCPSQSSLHLDQRLSKVPTPYPFQPVGVAPAPTRPDDDVSYDLDLLLQETDADLQLCQQELENLSLLVPTLEDLYETTIQIQEAMQQKEMEYQQNIIVVQREFENLSKLTTEKVRDEAEMKVKELTESLTSKEEAIKQQERQYQETLRKEREEADAREKLFKQKTESLAKEMAQVKAKSEQEKTREAELHSQIDSLHRKLKEQMEQNEAVNFSLQKLEEEAQAKVTAAESKVRANHEILQTSLLQVASKEKHLTAQVKKIASLLQEMKAKVLVSPRIFRNSGQSAPKAPATVDQHSGYKTNGFHPMNGASHASVQPPLVDIKPVASSGDYLSALSGSTSTSTPKKSFAPYSQTAKPVVRDMGYLGNLNSVATTSASSHASAVASASTPTKAAPASTAGYFSTMPSSSAASGPKKSYAPGGGLMKIVKESGYLGNLNAVSESVPSNSNTATTSSSAPTTTHAAPATTGDYLSAMSGSTAHSGPKRSYAPGGGSMKVVKESSYLSNLSGSAHAGPSYSPPADTSTSASTTTRDAPATTGDYLSAMSGPTAHGGPKKSYAPGGGSLKVVKDSGYLGNLNAVASPSLSYSPAPETSNSDSTTKSSLSTGDYLSAMSGSSASTGPKKSYAPGGGSMKVVKETGYLSNLSSNGAASTASTPAHVPKSTPSHSPADSDAPSTTVTPVSTGDYLKGISGSSASAGPKKSYAPGVGSFKVVKETGYFGNLNSAAGTPLPSYQSASKPIARAAPASTGDYLKAMSGSSASAGPKKSYAPGGGSFKVVKETGYFANLNSAAGSPLPSNQSTSKPIASAAPASTGDYLKGMSGSSASAGLKKSYAPGGGSFKVVKESGYFANLNAPAAGPSAADQPASAASVTSERATSASTGDYLSAMSRAPPTSSTPKKSYAPGGGSMKVVKDSGYLSNLNAVAPLPSQEANPSPTKDVAANESPKPVAASSGDYLSALNRSPMTPGPKKLFAPGGNKIKPAADGGYLGGLSQTRSPTNEAPKLFTIEPKVKSTSEYLKTMSGASTADFLSAMSRNSTEFTGGNMMTGGEPVVRTPVAKETPAENVNEPSSSQKSSAPASTSDYLSSMSSASKTSYASFSGPKKSFAPGAGMPKAPPATGYLGALANAAPMQSYSPASTQEASAPVPPSSPQAPEKPKESEAPPDTGLSSSVASLYSSMPPRPVPEAETEEKKAGWLKDAVSPIRSYLSNLRN